MRVSKWGKSLALRLPAIVVEALTLREGDEIEVRIAGARVLEVSRKRDTEELVARLRKFRGRLPRDFTFDRNDVNSRR
jgi:antitoxin MazE